MIVPQPLHLIHPDYADPVDVTTQIDRLPGTVDAVCICNPYPNRNEPCSWPWCPWKTPLEEDE